MIRSISLVNWLNNRSRERADIQAFSFPLADLLVNEKVIGCLILGQIIITLTAETTIIFIKIGTDVGKCRSRVNQTCRVVMAANETGRSRAGHGYVCASFYCRTQETDNACGYYHYVRRSIFPKLYAVATPSMIRT